MKMNINIEKQIEFDKIKEMWSLLAVTDAAKERIAQIAPIMDETELRKELRDTTNSREFVEKTGMPPLQNVTELEEILVIAQRGDCLNPYQLERVEKVLVVVERLRKYLTAGRKLGNPLAYYDENLDPLQDLHDALYQQIRNEAVDDRASNVLMEVRSSIMRTEESMKQKAEQVIRNNKDCMSDTFYTIRNGRICVPVKKEYRFKIPGSVIDRSSTGSTFFVEPLGVAKYSEELAMLRIREEDEVRRILYTLTAMVADAAPFMEENRRMIEKLDYLFSKGKLSMDLCASEPAINVERRILLKQARHPLMDPAVNVPLDFSLGCKEISEKELLEQKLKKEDAGVRGIVITGPNTGGKTVAIKTVMLSCYMAQCGLHVPCECADLCMNGNYLCDIGDGQNLSENLSTFSAHIRNVLEILKNITSDSFVIMDELGSGTDPAEGMGIAIAILEELRKSGANFLVTTHYPEVKDYADRSKNIINARMTFDRDTLLPTYKMVIGEAGESCAFYIADRLGMPRHMLKTAVESAYGEGAAEKYRFQGNATQDQVNTAENKPRSGKIQKSKKNHVDTSLAVKYKIGDSVMVFPDKKIGIVCEPINEKGVMRVQIADRKIWINHKRVKLYIKAEELYPENYDFSIIFDSVNDRKIRHDQERKYTQEMIMHDED